MSVRTRPTRLFLDANVLFAAAWTPAGAVAYGVANGGPQRLWLTCEFAHREALRNILAKKPQSLSDLQRLMALVSMTEGATTLDLDIPLRAKDRPILASAIAADADYLITGDKRDYGPFLGRPELTGGVCVLTLTLYRDLAGPP